MANYWNSDIVEGCSKFRVEMRVLSGLDGMSDLTVFGEYDADTGACDFDNEPEDHHFGLVLEVAIADVFEMDKHAGDYETVDDDTDRVINIQWRVLDNN
jgi:hypothetical protein